MKVAKGLHGLCDNGGRFCRHAHISLDKLTVRSRVLHGGKGLSRCVLIGAVVYGNRNSLTRKRARNGAADAARPARHEGNPSRQLTHAARLYPTTLSTGS
ncbi:MAG: hypothetical protein NVS2B16_06190 [Chloroflexota bacterium]